MSTAYPHKYEVVIDRRNVRTGRPLVSLTAYSGDDEDEAREAYARRCETAGRGCRVRFEVRQTIQETFPQIFTEPLDNWTRKG